MYGDAATFRNLDDLRRYVHERICDQNELEVNYFQVTERILTRREQPCGIFFCLHGPRSVKFTAIWETDRNRILFYGSSGERLPGIKLHSSPALHMATL
jgi:hypothetical protein